MVPTTLARGGPSQRFDVWPGGRRQIVNRERKIFWIKFVHSLFFILMTVCLLYLLYSGLFDRVGWLTLIAIVLMFGEGVVLAASRCRCPLTKLAEDLGAEDGSVTGIFLPHWLAKRVFIIWPPLFVGACILVLIRYLHAR